MADAEDVVPPVTVAEVNACRYSAWRPLFRARPRCLPRSTVIPLPDAFVAYLHADGVRLPVAPPGTSLSPGDPRHDDGREGGSPVSWASSHDGGESDAEGGGSEADEVRARRRRHAAVGVSPSRVVAPVTPGRRTVLSGG